MSLSHRRLETCLHEVQEVRLVPEISIQRNDPQLWIDRMVDAVGCIVHASLIGGFRRDPVVLLPKRGNVVIVPRSERSDGNNTLVHDLLLLA